MVLRSKPLQFHHSNDEFERPRRGQSEAVISQRQEEQEGVINRLRSDVSIRPSVEWGRLPPLIFVGYLVVGECRYIRENAFDDLCIVVKIWLRERGMRRLK